MAQDEYLAKRLEMAAFDKAQVDGTTVEEARAVLVQDLTADVDRLQVFGVQVPDAP